MSSISGTSVNTIPIISSDTIDQTVRIKENETAALAGIVDRQIMNSINGTPGVAGLPAVGLLAGDQNNQTQGTELLILVTPRLVRLAPRIDHVIYAGPGALEGSGAIGAPTGLPTPPPAAATGTPQPPPPAPGVGAHSTLRSHPVRSRPLRPNKHRLPKGNPPLASRRGSLLLSLLPSRPKARQHHPRASQTRLPQCCSAHQFMRHPGRSFGQGTEKNRVVVSRSSGYFAPNSEKNWDSTVFETILACRT